ncbi:MAG: hypothetical protein QOJ35_2651 [Solirubrobacteraceae bacterium]|jgi:uncharacterized circularly permuted ATP-grasp superfamily protein|nr:hypothetical protein [Solirubrobacteraceae bacterium]
MGSERPALERCYDEERDAEGAPRAGYAEALRALEGSDLDGLRRAVADELKLRGVSFGADPFVVDPVPRLLTAAEWDPLAAGLAQRAGALNRFLLDAYGERRIVTAGVVASATIEQANGYEPELVGRLPPHGSPAAVIGFDVVRAPDGEFLVLEDNLRTPSGFAYALAAREALAAVLPAGLRVPRAVDPIAYELLERAIRAAAPADRDDAQIVVLTDGPGNVAYYEHAQAAHRLGAVLATLDDLVRDGDGLRVRVPGREPREVDVVYRRTNDDALRDERGEPTAVARMLLEPWLSGRIGLVNAFGNGLADDKFVHGCVEDCIRFYLHEEPLVRSVPTHDAAASGGGRPSIDALRELVVKPRGGSGGNGVVIGAHANREDLERQADELERHPEGYVTQPIVPLSRHPTVIDGRLEPRHVDLRAFAFCGQDVALLPGGLTRVALDAGTLVVNSSQHGGGKDTWIVD